MLTWGKVKFANTTRIVRKNFVCLAINQVTGVPSNWLRPRGNRVAVHHTPLLAPPISQLEDR